MLIAEVLFVDENLTVSDCAEAETNKSHLYPVNTSQEPGGWPVLSCPQHSQAMTNYGVSGTAVSDTFALKHYDCSQGNPIQLYLKQDMFLIGISTPLLSLFFHPLFSLMICC